MNIADTIQQQIDRQVSMKELEEKFSDGQPHELLFFQGVFLDGVALNTPDIYPLLKGTQAISYGEFCEALEHLSEGLIDVARNVVNEDHLIIRAVASAALIFINGMMATNGNSEPTPEIKSAAGLIAKALAVVDAGWDISKAMGHPEAALTEFRNYLDANPLPVTANVAGGQE